MADRVRADATVSRRAFLALGGALVLAGCGGRRRREGGGRRGWFGFGRSNEPETLEPEGGFLAARVDPRPLAPRVDAMTIERVTGGIIVRANAVMPSQGFWDADLVPALGDNPEDGIYRLDFRAWPPTSVARVGPPRSRELTVAAFIASGDLDEVRTIAVTTQAGTISRSP